MTSSASQASACPVSTTGKKMRTQSKYYHLVLKQNLKTQRFYRFTCSHFTEISYGVVSSPNISKDFKAALKQLPPAYNAKSKEQFYRLIDNFGTHYLSKVTYNKTTDFNGNC